MLRRLEKSLNNAKAKQPSNAQSSSSTAPASQEDGAGPSNFSPSAAQQYDEEMEEEEDDRPEEPIYPEKVIRSSRSSFLDVVMNPVPAAADHDRPHSDSSADRPHSAPKSASQSPSRLQSSPQPRPYIGLFGGNVPKDPVAAGILSESDVEPLFDIFFLRLNPFINLFDPSLHSPAYVRRHSPFLFTAILIILNHTRAMPTRSSAVLLLSLPTHADWGTIMLPSHARWLITPLLASYGHSIGLVVMVIAGTTESTIVFGKCG